MISEIDWCNYFSFSYKSLKVSISNKSLWQYVVLGITFYFLLGNLRAVLLAHTFRAAVIRMNKKRTMNITNMIV